VQKMNGVKRGIREAAEYAHGNFLRIWGKTYSRQELAQMGIVSWRAARRLSNLMARKHIKGPEDLTEYTQADLREYKRVGDRAIYVAMQLLEAHRYDPVKWVMRVEEE
jgi:hypothetical protein